MKIEGIAYSHEYLWRASSRSLVMAETNDQEQYYLLMQSLLTAYLAFEAFVNFLGEYLDPDTWKDEKEFFKQKPYHGIEGKVKRLAEKLSDFKFKKGQAPYQTIKKVGDFRNILGHGKPYPFEKEVPYKGYKSDMFEFDWDEYLSLTEVKRGREAIKKFCESLRSAAYVISKNGQEPCLEDMRKLHLHHKAFEGPLALSNGATKKKNGFPPARE